MRTTTIEWCHHTFNPWHGCVKVGPGCDHCYAEAFDRRIGRAVWGKDEPRWFQGPKAWAEPLKWNQGAEKAGERRRVFCASMADVFEERDDLNLHRERLWDLIRKTPALDWLLLTKRANAIRRSLPPDIPNVWPGVSVENEDYLWRVKKLLTVECAGPKWVSYEPALGPVNFRPYFGQGRIEWVVIGGESGAKARPFDALWAEAVIRDCRDVGVAAFVKQMGTVWAKTRRSTTYKGGGMSEWPEGLRVREYPRA